MMILSVRCRRTHAAIRSPAQRNRRHVKGMAVMEGRTNRPGWWGKLRERIAVALWIVAAMIIGTLLPLLLPKRDEDE